MCIYKNRWKPAVGVVVVCDREPHNAADGYSVTIAKGGVVVGFCDEVV